MKKIVTVIGGCGFTGTQLVNKLLLSGYKVNVIDNQMFGRNLRQHKNLSITKLDIRKHNKLDFKNSSTIIHLANIANDPGVELSPLLSWETNVLASKFIIERAIKDKVKKFIFASSGSVYGFKKEKKVTENLDLEPISYYNKTKMIAERVFMSYSDDIQTFIIRPATVCGISNRMRLDVSVNALTYSALSKKKITVFGGSQIRPNIHIDDLIDVYIHFLKNSIKPGIYNAGFENLSINQIAKIVRQYIPCKIEKTKTNDIRSYRLNSDKLIQTGFKPKYNITKAILDMIEEYKKGKLVSEDRFYTVNWMKKNNFK